MNVASFHTHFFILGVVKSGLAVLSCLSFALSSPHSTISAFILWLFPYSLHSNKQAGLFVLLIFPRCDRNRCFPSILMVHAGSAGQIWGDGKLCCVFSWQGAVSYFVWLALCSSWGRPKSTLATRTQFCPHVHTLPPQDQGRRRPDDKGTGFSLGLRENLCPLPMWFLCPTQDHKGCAAKHSRLHRLGWKIPDHKHTHRHTKHHPHCHLYSASLYTASCASWHYVMAEKECHSTGME